jgi:hypothetical protein
MPNLKYRTGRLKPAKKSHFHGDHCNHNNFTNFKLKLLNKDEQYNHNN